VLARLDSHLADLKAQYAAVITEIAANTGELLRTIESSIRERGECVLRTASTPESGYDIRTVQELPGHRDVAATMLYTHVLNRGGLGVRSPIGQLTGQNAVLPIWAAVGNIVVFFGTATVEVQYLLGGLEARARTRLSSNCQSKEACHERRLHPYPEDC
jgi:hypothetical protein